MNRPTLSTINTIIEFYKAEIIREEDWFYNFENHTLNVFQGKDGVFKAVLYDAPGNATQWATYHRLPSLNFTR
jgi:hypothetical protein